jgi:L-lactate dehydrogenase complex protein LldG
VKREDFLAKVRDAASRGRAYRPHTRQDLGSDVGYCGAGDNKVDRLAAEINTVGGHAHVVADMTAACAQLAALLNQYAPRRALCWQHPLLERLGLNALLKEMRIEQSDHATLSSLDVVGQRTAIMSADVGITSASYAVAESGTLAMASGPGRERLASLAPPVHIAIIEEQQILPDLFDLFDVLVAAGPEGLASNLTLITGPSKTGDLELRLITGVHGPGKWHVIIMRNGA